MIEWILKLLMIIVFMIIAFSVLILFSPHLIVNIPNSFLSILPILAFIFFIFLYAYKYMKGEV
jgi:hypothetical protein